MILELKAPLYTLACDNTKDRSLYSGRAAKWPKIRNVRRAPAAAKMISCARMGLERSKSGTVAG